MQFARRALAPYYEAGPMPWELWHDDPHAVKVKGSSRITLDGSVTIAQALLALLSSTTARNRSACPALARMARCRDIMAGIRAELVHFHVQALSEYEIVVSPFLRYSLGHAGHDWIGDVGVPRDRGAWELGFPDALKLRGYPDYSVEELPLVFDTRNPYAYPVLMPERVQADTALGHCQLLYWFHLQALFTFSKAVMGLRHVLYSSLMQEGVAPNQVWRADAVVEINTSRPITLLAAVKADRAFQRAMHNLVWGAYESFDLILKPTTSLYRRFVACARRKDTFTQGGHFKGPAYRTTWHCDFTGGPMLKSAYDSDPASDE